MSSTATPRGLMVVGTKVGAAYNGKLAHYPITTTYNTAIFYGDVVKLASDGTINKATTTTGTTNTPFGIGVFLGCTYTDPNTQTKVWRQYWPQSTAATDAVAFVYDDPNGVFQVQANGSLGHTARGTVIDLIQTSGTTVYGTSKVALNAASSTDSTTGPFRIVGFVDGPDSALGDSYTDVLVTWADGQHQYASGTRTSI